MGNINSQFILTLFIIALGYFGKRLNLLKEQDGETISRLIFNFTLPALIINTFSSITIDFSLGLLPVLCIVYNVAVILISLFIFRKESRKTRGLFTLTASGFNIGLFAYPLVEAIWGKEGLKYFGMFDMGNAVILFGICYVIASYFASEESSTDYKAIFKKVSRSVPLLSYIITLLINLAGLHYPKFILDLSQVFARGNMALSLLLLGLYLNFSFEKKYWKSMLKILSLRYILGAIAGISLYFLLPLDKLFQYTVVIGFILPIGMAIVPYSVEFDYDKKFMGTIINFTIIISFLLIWLISGILMK